MMEGRLDRGHEGWSVQIPRCGNECKSSRGFSYTVDLDRAVLLLASMPGCSFRQTCLRGPSDLATCWPSSDLNASDMTAESIVPGMTTFSLQLFPTPPDACRHDGRPPMTLDWWIFKILSPLREKYDIRFSVAPSRCPASPGPPP